MIFQFPICRLLQSKMPSFRTRKTAYWKLKGIILIFKGLQNKVYKTYKAYKSYKPHKSIKMPISH